MTVEVSKVTAYAVIRPPINQVAMSKFATYVVMAPQPIPDGGPPQTVIIIN